ncbi:hypothetical protein PORCRE_1506 [Porphyromonas crevioricanis JCM 15906]|uniref:Uncharacterized protein n=1 Tax=Porphyromonas crevioricanis JCM 15906 TaxID=1305617 RepID=T1CRT8_9PORP|nr:hypothetical protein PORCRE_1506 [Porphyromonas crevioricanis JCM 15906]
MNISVYLSSISFISKEHFSAQIGGILSVFSLSFLMSMGAVFY